MARWTPDARRRLAETALDLYIEQGFEQTTVAQIAGQAGLTERTFYRHFADKREVLFARSAVLEARMVEAVGQAPPGRALDLLVAGLEAADSFNEDSRRWSQRRQQVISANAPLLERELSKLNSLRAGFAGALVQRGFARGAAALAAEVGVIVYRQAFELWIDSPAFMEWKAAIRQARAELEAVLASSAPDAVPSAPSS
ncbi:TetR/AcrR family transcriptional regulator [Deinococcus sp. HMF7604]|uniref:TetR/AcrR family transcriptional regulator n=1 Tax=Deinococcus betulae TaxID=2873312 RepID=UPI001CCB7447|nr:TetR/AcrR family transcriptional regulator [Deinococcus betulae]MBZ9750427.1 TetR/AcrR family transcriptional regulator [Deinococcus betulae]